MLGYTDRPLCVTDRRPTLPTDDSADGRLRQTTSMDDFEYQHIVGQTTQTSYNRYGLLSCQGHAVRPPWGIVLPRTWVDSDNP